MIWKDSLGPIMRWKELFEKSKRVIDGSVEERIGMHFYSVMGVMLRFMLGGEQIQRDGGSLRNWLNK